MYIYVYQINIQGVSFIFHYIWSIWQNASLKGVVSFIDFTILLLELILSRVLRLFFVNFAARNKQFHVTSLRKFKKITLLLRFLIYILIYIFFFFFPFIIVADREWISDIDIWYIDLRATWQNLEFNENFLERLSAGTPMRKWLKKEIIFSYLNIWYPENILL